MDKITLTRITLLRTGGSTSYPLINIYPEQIKGQPRIGYSCEELVGEVISPEVSIAIYFDTLPISLTDEPGGTLYNFNPELEDLICRIFLSDSTNPAWIGDVVSWQWSQGDQALIMAFNGGLEVLRRLRLEDIANRSSLLPGNILWTEDQIGRPAEWLIDQIYGNNQKIFTVLTFDDYRLSYMEHPERRFCTGEDAAIATPTTNLAALGYGNNKVWGINTLDVLAYDITSRLWEYHFAISNPGLLAINGLSWQALYTQYNVGAYLDILLTRIPLGMVRGTSPNSLQHQVYQLTNNLVGNTTLVTSWYQHQHERVASRSLRYEGDGSGGTASLSAEAIGTFVPSPPDQTYGSMIYPKNALNITLPIGSLIVLNGAIILLGDYHTLANKGAILIINTSPNVNRTYHLGYIISAVFDGTYTILIPYTPVGENYPVIGGNVFIRYYDSLPATVAMPSPNILITDPAMVSVEYPTSTAGLPPGVTSAVRVLRRSSLWGGSPSFVTGDSKLTLPCKLNPGYYCFASQTNNFADIPASTNKDEQDTAAFVITIERPRYICDLAKNITQRDDVPPAPAGVWGHEQGMGKSRLYLNSIADLEIYGRAQTRNGNYILTTTTTNPLYTNGVVFPQYWQVNHSGSSYVSGYPYKTIANASYLMNGYHHVAEQQIIYAWKNTGGTIATALDTSNLNPAIYASGIATDLYIAGTVDVKIGDLICFGSSGIANETQGIYIVDDSEPYYGTPGGLPLVFYTRICIYPQPGLAFIQPGFTQIFVLRNTTFAGRWLKYESDWSSYTVIRNCTIDTAIELDGQEQLKRDAKTPAGKSFVVEYDDNTGVYRCDLGEIALSSLDNVRLDNGIRLVIESTDPSGMPLIYPQPDNPGLVYSSSNCGSNELSHWIICHPALAGQTLWIAYKYYQDDLYIEDMWEQPNGDLWAMEHGSGKLYRYTDANGIETMQDMARGQIGALAPFIGDTNNTYSISEPSGYLCKLGTQHSGHIDKLALDLKIPDALGAIAKAMDCRVFLNGKGILKVISNQGIPLSPTYYDKFSVRAPTPVVSFGLEIENIRVSYDGGVSQATKDIRYRSIDMVCIQTYHHAHKLCEDYYNRGNKGLIDVNIPITDFVNELGDEIAVPKPDKPYNLGNLTSNGRIINYENDLGRQITTVKLRRV